MLRLAIGGCLCAILAQAAGITVDYPADGSIFPPEIIAPTVLWRDTAGAAKVWRIEITFADHTRAIRVTSHGEKMPIGEIDERCAKAGAVPPTLTPQEAEGHSWKPEASVWETLKHHSVHYPATITITGFESENATEPVSEGHVTIHTSSDPVGAPLFYRDVPLIPFPGGEKGIIMPLPKEAIPLIAWRLLYIGQERSKVMMSGLPTCANCHSFSHDGKTLGLDVDGPQNDKGLYGLVPVRQVTYIRNEDVIHWNSFAEEKKTKRFGFMSQISPDGQYVVTSIEPPGVRIRDFDARLFNGFYNNYGFGQVFYPTRGVLAWYSRASGKLQLLPGADDPRYVQTSAFWSPDGKYLVFSRAEAKDPYSPGQKPATYANDPNETQIQYDLYRIPFNGGRGGQAERVVGASQNGMSNNFPKVSPERKWIVYVENKNGLLMRPDSRLYIVPFEGGAARPLRANTPRMNSWHSFSPNGRWLVFSSKGRSLYTQLYLTHIDPDGTDSPAIRIENATAANRAVNIPEFANIPPGGLEKIETPAIEFYRMFDVAVGLTEKGDFPAAETAWQKAMSMDPEDSKARYNFGLTLDREGKLPQAITEYRKSVDINPQNAAAFTNLGIALSRQGKLDDAVEALTQSVAIRPANAMAQSNLAAALIEKGQTDQAVAHIETALEADPDFADAHNMLGIILGRAGRLDEGIAHLEKAVARTPDSPEYRFNLGRLLAARGRFADAIPHFEQAVKLSGGQEPQSLEMLAAMYAEVGRFAQAAEVARHALEIAERNKNTEMEERLIPRIADYEQHAAH
ncbi:MAG TPA: tetratricopeptide repeat protein [Bryobacteraceae bacterium]|nr:tetratricopeptide repeat protein [Bryobacteraceae bacterium]